MVRNVGRRMYGWIYMCSPTSCIIPVLAFSFPDWLNIIKYPFCNLPNNYLPNHSFNLFNFQKKKKMCSPLQALLGQFLRSGTTMRRLSSEHAVKMQNFYKGLRPVCVCVCFCASSHHSRRCAGRFLGSGCWCR